MLLGDLVADVATKLGVKSCIPCTVRQARLNAIHQEWKDELSTLKVKLFGQPGESGASDSESQPT